ncbi:MAG: ABC transporter substrate-binding protein [Thermodesulfobacteriota bacterium]
MCRKRCIAVCLVFLFLLTQMAGRPVAETLPATGPDDIRMAVEFMDHAAAAFVARDKGWFEEAGLKVTAYESYGSGMALAAALARGDIDAAFICLVPAVNSRLNAGVPVKIVAGTHKHGYGVVVNREKVKTTADLARPDVRVGCIQQGGAVDVMFNKAVDFFHLDRDAVFQKVRRMPPEKQVLALQTGQLDTVVLPEQWATMVEAMGFDMLFTSRDVWPDMQGSVLVVKEELVDKRPGAVKKLVAVLGRSTGWINSHPMEAAEAVARQLQTLDGGTALNAGAGPAITPQIIARSMGRMTFTIAIDPAEVQRTIDYMAHLGYLKKPVPASEILDLRFLEAGGAQ